MALEGAVGMAAGARCGTSHGMIGRTGADGVQAGERHRGKEAARVVVGVPAAGPVRAKAKVAGNLSLRVAGKKLVAKARVISR
mmetsp:Transcript_15472/g.36260  ORF Transcript_15472/g.36260 Transcript_15472/m.36260 type:complete len:83 (-) Transcript_15472:170-418(-)